MTATRPVISRGSVRLWGAVLLAVFALPLAAGAQSLNGALIGTVKDAQGGVLQGALVRVTSPALIGGERQTTTNDKGQWRFPVLPPGTYALTVELRRRSRPTAKRTSASVRAPHSSAVVLKLAGVAESVSVKAARASSRGGAGSRPDSDSNTSRRSPRAGSACSIRSERARRLAHVAVQRHRQHGVGVRIRRQRERVHDRRHQFHVPVSGRVARRAKR